MYSSWSFINVCTHDPRSRYKTHQDLRRLPGPLLRSHWPLHPPPLPSPLCCYYHELVLPVLKMHVSRVIWLLSFNIVFDILQYYVQQQVCVRVREIPFYEYTTVCPVIGRHTGFSSFCLFDTCHFMDIYFSLICAYQ